MKRVKLFLFLLIVILTGCNTYIPENSSVSVFNDDNKGTVNIDKTNLIIGDYFNLTVKAKEGYKINYNSLRIDGGYIVSKNTNTSYTFESTWTIVAIKNFVKVDVSYNESRQYYIQYKTNSYGTVEINTENKKNIKTKTDIYNGANVTVKIKPNKYYHLKDGKLKFLVDINKKEEVSVDYKKIDENTYTFVMPEDNINLYIEFISDIYFEPVIDEIIKGGKLKYKIINKTDKNIFDVYINDEIYKANEILNDGSYFEIDTANMIEGWIEISVKNSTLNLESIKTDGFINYSSIDIPNGYREIKLKIKEVKSNSSNSKIKDVAFELPDFDPYGSLKYNYYFESNPNDIFVDYTYSNTFIINNVVQYDRPNDTLYVFIYDTNKKIISGKCKIKLEQCSTILQQNNKIITDGYIDIPSYSQNIIEWENPSEKDVYFTCNYIGSYKFEIKSLKPTSIPRKVFFKDSENGDRKAFLTVTVNYLGEISVKYQNSIQLFFSRNTINQQTNYIKTNQVSLNQTKYSFYLTSENSNYKSIDDLTFIITDKDNRNDVKATFENISENSNNHKIDLIPDYSTFHPVSGDEYKIWLFFEGIVANPLTIQIE